MTYLFSQVGMKSKKDAELVNLGSAAASALGALKARRVDALAFFQPIAQQAEAAGGGSNYISPARRDVPDLAHSVHGVVFTTQRILDKKPKEVAAFQHAIERAQRDIHEHPGEMKGLLAGYLKGTDPEALAALPPIMQAEIPEGIGFSRASFDTAIRFHRTTGLVKRLPAYEEIVPEALRIDSPR